MSQRGAVGAATAPIGGIVMRTETRWTGLLGWEGLPPSPCFAFGAVLEGKGDQGGKRCRPRACFRSDIGLSGMRVLGRSVDAFAGDKGD